MSATGDYIREAREQKGLTLGQVEEETRIPRYYLEILEGGGDDRLVSDRLYMVHFLRGYAAFLEVEVETLAAQFVRENRRTEAAAEIPPPRGRSRTAVVLAAAAVLLVAGAGAYVLFPGIFDFEGPGMGPPVVSAPAPTPAKEPVAPPLPVAAPTPEPDSAASSVLQPEADEAAPSEPRLVATLPQPEPNPPVETATPAQAPPDEPVTAAENPSVATLDGSEPGQPAPGRDGDRTGSPDAPETTLATAASEPAADAPATHSLTIFAEQKSWLRIWVDGEPYKDMLLSPGTTRTLSAQTHFIITFGNAGGVRLTLNGEELPPAGTSGQVVRGFKLPPDP